ncbi:mitochondrial 54S ribosomal protein uL22m [Aspergillus undulatus]|uniref:mitochondrial 54S ribosomal protein uL22m n=1 Tax=Aspergillus undulatus TaxID=1810928 RepID=UPI003CCD5D08
MATMASLHSYGHLIRSARSGITYVPRRTLTYTPIRRAEEQNNKPEAPKQQSSSTFSSIKNFFGFGGKASEAPKPTVRKASGPPKKEGALSTDSIFAEDEAGPKLTASGRTPSRKQAGAGAPKEGETAEEADYSIEKRNRANMAAVLDPRPKARLTWERKMAIREVRQRGRLSKTQQIMRAERETLAKSHWFKTSIKKLGPLARQIAGKNIDEAIVQMQFSKKKAAKDVLGHLKHAKNMAIVRSGMGLGAQAVGPDGEEVPKPKPLTIVSKTGERKTITDPTSIYIDQAWVNRGPYGMDFDHRARGVINRLRPPHTSLSVVLKEEKTRIREWQDREARELRKRKAKLWTQLPDRPVTQQNQYYSW